MDGSSTPSSKPNPTAGGASKFLADLPSSGLFSSTVISSNLGGMRVYITDNETSPPEHQLIRTDPVNILIRALVLKKQKGESSSKSKGATGNEGSRKRAAERALDGRASSKRAISNNQNGSRQEGSKFRIPEKDFQSLTVERLRALLKVQGLPIKGKKDELIARLKAAQG